MLKKKQKLRQYEIPVGAKFIVHAESLKEARELIERQLNGMATTSVVVGAGQMLVPQEVVPEDENSEQM